MSTKVGGIGTAKLSQSVTPKKTVFANAAMKSIAEEKADTVEIGGKKKINKKTVAKGAAALATVAGAAYLLKSGKGKQIFDSLNVRFKQALGKPLSMEQVKANYKTSSVLETGWHKSDPKYYTGEVLAKAKNGNETLLSYEGGAIKHAITKNPEGEVVLEKAYGDRMIIESQGTVFTPITTIKSDGTVTKAAVGNYELSFAEEYPKFSIDSTGKTHIEPGYEELLEEGQELAKIIY